MLDVVTVSHHLRILDILYVAAICCTY